MLPCDEVRELAEEYVHDTLSEARRREVASHLRVCEPCHRLMDEARLARLVLEEAGPPPAPPRLAERIKHAALMRQRHRPRPLHQRALGSPAFLATCASLLCGAIICLLAIMKVAAVQPWPEAPPLVSTVVRMKLPARDVEPLALRGAAPVLRAGEAVRSHRHPVSSLLTVPTRLPYRPAPPRAEALIAAGPQRPLTAFIRSTPSLSLIPTLPEAMLAPASARISQPENVRPAPQLESLVIHALLAPLDDQPGRLETTDLASPQSLHGDFTSTH